MKDRVTKRTETPDPVAKPQSRKPADSLSMHSGVPVWCDCCTCEAEPYWVEAFAGEDDPQETAGNR